MPKKVCKRTQSRHGQKGQAWKMTLISGDWIRFSTNNYTSRFCMFDIGRCNRTDKTTTASMEKKKTETCLCAALHRAKQERELRLSGTGAVLAVRSGEAADTTRAVPAPNLCAPREQGKAGQGEGCRQPLMVSLFSCMRLHVMESPTLHGNSCGENTVCEASTRNKTGP